MNIAIVEEGMGRLDESRVLKLPPKVLRLFADLLGSSAQGKAVAIMPKELDVTTQEAAMFLNVSRPYLVKLLDEGQIPHHKVGTHRQIRFEDVVWYKVKIAILDDVAPPQFGEQCCLIDLGPTWVVFAESGEGWSHSSCLIG